MSRISALPATGLVILLLAAASGEMALSISQRAIYTAAFNLSSFTGLAKHSGINGFLHFFIYDFYRRNAGHVRAFDSEPISQSDCILYDLHLFFIGRRDINGTVAQQHEPILCRELSDCNLTNKRAWGNQSAFLVENYL